MIHKNRFLSPDKAIYILLAFFFLSVAGANAQSNSDLINPLAKKHLTQIQIDTLSKHEIDMINYMYTSSFIVDTTNKYYKKWLNEKGGIDVALLNQQRKQSERAYCRFENYPGLVIELLSWDEMKAEAEKILNNK